MSDSGPCGRCAHFDRAGTPPSILESGFGLCAQMKVKWRYMSEQAACVFTVSRFARSAPVRADALPEDIDFG